MYNPKDIIDIIAGNVRKTRNPFGIPQALLNRWHKHLDIPSRGQAMIFTGMMYQFMPYIETSTQYLARFEGGFWADYIRFAKWAPSYLSGLGLAMMTPSSEKKKTDLILSNIVRILRASKVDFFYNPKLDHYSGVLLYDLGDQESFVEHARFVGDLLKRAGITDLITLDPHTTYTMKVLFPKYVGIEFTVRTYFELINVQSQNGNKRITLHDPCFYGRYLELSDAPRKILSQLGIECAPIRNSGLFTNCCGGPAESISPKLSSELVERRLEELRVAGENIVSMCPICMGNLKKAGANVMDLSTVIAGRL